MTGVILKLLDVQLKSIILPPPWFCLFKTVITLVWWSAVRGPGPFVQGEVTLGPFYSPDTRTDFDVGEAESCSPVAIITWLLPEWTVNWFHVLFSDPSFGTTSSSLLSPPPPVIHFVRIGPLSSTSTLWHITKYSCSPLHIDLFVS